MQIQKKVVKQLIGVEFREKKTQKSVFAVLKLLE